MRGDNVLAKVCRCASGMNLHEMRLSRAFGGPMEPSDIHKEKNFPRRFVSTAILPLPSPPGWGGGHVFLIKQPAAPLQHVFANDFPAPLR